MSDRDALAGRFDKSDRSVAHLRATGVRIEYSASQSSGRKSKEPGISAVDGADLALNRGDFVCIVGPSGCGKTTFLNAVAGFLRISKGTLELDGKEITSPGPERSMVFQHPSLLPWRTVTGNVMYGLDLTKTGTKAERRDRARDLLDLVGLADYGSYYPTQLSGGMQQRVNLARALAVDPELLLLDEPFASIDAQTREVMQVELLRICAAREVSALFVTHDISEAVLLADRVCVFGPKPGRIVHEVTVPLDRPRDLGFRRQPEFLSLVDEITDRMHQAVDAGTAPAVGGARA